MPIYINPLLPFELVNSLLKYELDTNLLRWKVSRGPVKPGNVVSARQVMINGKIYETSRIIWLLHYGEDPYPFLIDHIDGDHNNNCINNLRLVTPSQNMQNSKVSLGTSGVRGVYACKGRWHAHITVNYQEFSGPLRDTIEEAAADREELVRKHHPYAPKAS